MQNLINNILNTIYFLSDFFLTAAIKNSLSLLRHYCSTSPFPWCSSSNAAGWSQINRFISLICKGFWLVPLSFSSSPGGLPVGFVCWHTLFMFFDLLLHELLNGWDGGLGGAIRFKVGLLVGLLAPLSESLGRSKSLMALVIWLLWCVLWWMVMQCFLMVPKLHHRVCRLFEVGV